VNKRFFGSLVTIFLLAVSPSYAQHPGKVFRIGYLSSVDPTTDAPRSKPIFAALQKLGYVEGQNLIVEYRYGGRTPGQAETNAAELVRLNVDLILVAGGDTLTRAAMKATKNIPIVMTGQGVDPIRAGIIESLARPGGNVTGFTITTELPGKRLELLKESVPKLFRVAVLFDPAVSSAVIEVKETLPAAARALGLTVQFYEVRDVDSFDKALAGLSKERPHGLLMPGGGGLLRPKVKQVVNFTLKNRVPSIYSEKQAVEAGGLMSYQADLVEGSQRVAYYIDRIFKGTKPADLPVEQPTKFEFVVNLNTAKQISLTISPDLLARATRIIR
jgi:putative tryptophan/tyrosine transport system substrate-binding protein